MNIQNIIDTFYTKLYAFAPKLVSGFLVLIIGLYISSIVAKQVKKSLLKSKIDDELALFLSKILKVLLQVTVIISSLSILGVKTSSFIAILGSAGLAIGLALQGSLSNLAGGVLILILKPFTLGNLIEYSGITGTVESIDIFTTKIKTADNKLVIIPNGPLANGIVINYSAKETRRNEWIFSIGYSDDIEKAKQLILADLQANEKIHSDPEPFIAVHQLADNSVNIVARAWSNSSDLWPVYFQTLENLKKSFDKEGISIPFPQRDVHIHNHQS
ncbi:MAG: mechanosensitive ion channel [Oligoflexia bacterium]|nr:mechanosensitive ion channel [Oligoflexia bacterium]